MIKVGEIAKRLGITVATAQYRLRRYHILPAMREGKDWLYADDTADRLASLNAAYHDVPSDLYTKSDIARLMGVDRAVVDRPFDGSRKIPIAHSCERVKYYDVETSRLIAFRAADKHFRRKYPPNTASNVRLYYRCRDEMVSEFNRKLEEEIECRKQRSLSANPAPVGNGVAAC